MRTVLALVVANEIRGLIVAAAAIAWLGRHGFWAAVAHALR